ncbi:MAG: 2-oxoglutarate dehydrogenase E1 component [Phycisphaerales bacterium]|nr:2-oxoglutarate dehydrogenase E1 component [Phycisphaerales bacterium]
MKPSDLINRGNAEYVDRLYEQYRKDPRALDEGWQTFFAGFEMGSGRSDAVTAAAATQGSPPIRSSINMGVFDLVHSYRELGHFLAQLDPLGHDRPYHPLLDLSNFGMSDADLDMEVGTGSYTGPTNGTLRDLVDKLKKTYCRTIGVEFTNISEKDQRDWLIQRMEPILNAPRFAPSERRAILNELVWAEEFEHFLHTRYVGQKRFSLEGAEALIPLVNTIVQEGAGLGAEKIIMGMAHRGRLNVLAHVLNKPYEILLSEFEGTSLPQDAEGDGDVKYHLGYANTRSLSGNKSVKVSLLPNPSHLELIDPIMEGIVRCQQQIFGDTARNRIIPLVMHGDAAFTGQGIVHETLNLSELRGFRTGGTIHIIINNQIGFTTDPKEGRFTPYPTDVAKMIQAPIFHVNGDDPEAVVHAARLAIAFRQEFRCDVMIDLWCYRRHGHNETDEPSFTQPVMYREIEAHPSVRSIYSQKLLDEKVVTQNDLDQMKASVLERLEASRTQAKEARPRQKVPTFAGVWKGLGRAGTDWSAKTAISREKLLQIAEGATRVPNEFTAHPKLQRLLASRLDAVKTGKGIDWGCAEMLAIGSLLLEGTPVRYSGQDVERGTFSHRQAVLHDYNTGEKYIPLRNLDEKQARFDILNTMLSELAVLGFEWGYASADPRNLIVWEAQFGDFVNGAQPIIDQILGAAESKWRYMNGLVMLLPHGYEGQGPEHSNAYLDRFLMLCAEDNVQVCYLSTAGQYFHALRRQIHRPFRKPLVLMMPKSLLRHEPSSCTVEELSQSGFQLVLDDPRQPERDSIKRLLLCSGKVYYTLETARQKAKLENVALVRVEQLYPFPHKEVQAILGKYRAVEEVGWVQEEPQNRGAWYYIERQIRDLLPDRMLTYYGREEAASPATGSFKMHQVEEQELIAHALDLTARQAASAARVQPATAGAQTSVAG